MSVEPGVDPKALRVLGVDPGRSKCGLAIVVAGEKIPVSLEIVPRPQLLAAVQRYCLNFVVDIIALGSGTEAKATHTEFSVLGVDIAVVDEYGSTLAARARYYEANPPRGWLRLLPRGLLVPDVPIDDWAAVIIAERYLLSLSPAQEA